MRISTLTNYLLKYLPYQEKSSTVCGAFFLAERERFELSRELTPPYRFSKPAPSATWVPLHIQYFKYTQISGGGGGIRTHGRLATTPVFKTGALVHYATP